LQQLRAVFRRQALGLFDELGLRGFIGLQRPRRPRRHRNTDLCEELFLSGWCANAQQPRRLLRSVDETVRRVGRDVDRLTCSDDRLLAAKGDFDFACEQGERLLEVVTVRRRPAAGRNVHVDQAVVAIGVVPREQNCVGIPREGDVGQFLVGVWPRDLEAPVEVLGGDRCNWLRRDGVLVHRMIDPTATLLLLPAESRFLRQLLITDGRVFFRVSPIAIHRGEAAFEIALEHDSHIEHGPRWASGKGAITPDNGEDNCRWIGRNNCGWTGEA
jgi:hypothetical protein